MTRKRVKTIWYTPIKESQILNSSSKNDILYFFHVLWEPHSKVQFRYLSIKSLSSIMFKCSPFPPGMTCPWQSHPRRTWLHAEPEWQLSRSSREGPRQLPRSSCCRCPQEEEVAEAAAAGIPKLLLGRGSCPDRGSWGSNPARDGTQSAWKLIIINNKW